MTDLEKIISGTEKTNGKYYKNQGLSNLNSKYQFLKIWYFFTKYTGIRGHRMVSMLK